MHIKWKMFSPVWNSSSTTFPFSSSAPRHLIDVITLLKVFSKSYSPYNVCEGTVGIFVSKYDIPSLFTIQRQDNLFKTQVISEGADTSTMSSILSSSPLITVSARSSCCFQGFSLLLTLKFLEKIVNTNFGPVSYLGYFPHLLNSRGRRRSEIRVDGRKKESRVGRREKVHCECVRAARAFFHPRRGKAGQAAQ